MKHSWIACLLFLLLLMSSSFPAFPQDAPRQNPLPSYRVVLPFRPAPQHGGPLITVRLNNTLNATFLVDTGSSNTMITHDVAKKLGLKVTKRTFPGQSPVEMTTIDSLVMGIFTMPVEVAVNDAPALKAGKIDGILGFSILERFATLFDFQRQTITLLSPAPLSASAVQDEGFAGEGQPLEPIPREGYAVRVRVNGKETSMFLDTGSFRTFIPRSFAQGEGARLLGESYSDGADKRDTIKMYAVRKVSVGNLSQDNVSCCVTLSQEQPDALLGMDILSRSRMLIDFPGRRVYFAPQTTPNLSSLANQQQSVGGAIFGPTVTGSFRIFTADENREFYRAGLRPGDTLISINQNAVATMLPDEITQEIIRYPTCRIVVMRRDGAEEKQLTCIINL